MLARTRAEIDRTVEEERRRGGEQETISWLLKGLRFPTRSRASRLCNLQKCARAFHAGVLSLEVRVGCQSLKVLPLASPDRSYRKASALEAASHIRWGFCAEKRGSVLEQHLWNLYKATVSSGVSHHLAFMQLKLRQKPRNLLRPPIASPHIGDDRVRRKFWRKAGTPQPERQVGVQSGRLRRAV